MFPSPLFSYFFLSVARAQIFPNKMGFVLLRSFEAFNISSIPRASTRISRLNRIRLLQTINAGYIGDEERGRASSMPCTCARGVWRGAGFNFRTLVSWDECFPHGRLTIGGESATSLSLRF